MRQTENDMGWIYSHDNSLMEMEKLINHSSHEGKIESVD